MPVPCLAARRAARAPWTACSSACPCRGRRSSSSSFFSWPRNPIQTLGCCTSTRSSLASPRHLRPVASTEIASQRRLRQETLNLCLNKSPHRARRHACLGSCSRTRPCRRRRVSSSPKFVWPSGVPGLGTVGTDVDASFLNSYFVGAGLTAVPRQAVRCGCPTVVPAARQ